MFSELTYGGGLVLIAIAIPFIAALLIWLTGNSPNQREAVTLTSAVALFVTVLRMLEPFGAGAVLHWYGPGPIPGVRIAFRVEILGMAFACVASFLWIAASLYSIGYMRGNNEPRQTRFYICFAIALGCTIGLAFADNLLTLFIFYEGLTLSTYPLVTHHKNEEAKAAGRTYLGLLMTTSIVLMLTAIIATFVFTGTTDFQAGGIMADKVAPGVGSILLLLFMYGTGKAALMPIHRWLPAAMVAPTPVSALLHAVAVVKAGVFTVVKISVYIFGIDYLQTLWSTDLVLYIATFTLLMASVIAMRQDNLKRRLAYSTVSQLSYVIVGAMLASTMGMVGASLQIVMHAFGKITLFFCAGAIYTAAHKSEISQMNGLGRVMPITFGAFLIGALSVIGLPPLGGAWSKLFLALGAAQAEHLLVIAALMISSLLNVVYLLAPVIRGFFMQPDGSHAQSGIHEAPLPSLIALVVTAIGCVALFFFADPIYHAFTALVSDQTGKP